MNFNNSNNALSHFRMQLIAMEIIFQLIRWLFSFGTPIAVIELRFVL